jgi:hypothetical protein
MESKMAEQKPTNGNGQGNGKATVPSLSEILRQQPLILDADTDNLSDKARNNQEDFATTFDKAVKNIANFPKPATVPVAK